MAPIRKIRLISRLLNLVALLTALALVPIIELRPDNPLFLSNLIPEYYR